MNSLIKASKIDTFPTSINLVISNNEHAEGLNISNSLNIKTYFANKKEFEKLAQFFLEEENVELICLAGFMQILSRNFVKKWRNRILNIHPSYLPNFKGLNAQKRVIKARASFSGCTVHYVNEKMDSGEIILQKKVILEANENTESLSKKILIEEHIIYPKALKIVANNILKI